MKLCTKADDKRSPFGYETLGPKAIVSGSGIVIILEYCKDNSLAFKYPLRLKLIGLDIEDVSFTMDQTKCHLEFGNTIYESCDFLAKRRLLVLLRLFFRIYYKETCLVSSQSASSVLPS
ncbi:hypothetical protein Adt_45008 [Abeliophyllum distichum]|uniref:Uncharacterized protein n=1 Tax=Abeliophyllum distichum TaxID=126358 RepID=A0ABD1PDX5_9LAMI